MPDSGLFKMPSLEDLARTQPPTDLATLARIVHEMKVKTISAWKGTTQDYALNERHSRGQDQATTAHLVVLREGNPRIDGGASHDVQALRQLRRNVAVVAKKRHFDLERRASSVRN